MPLHDVVWTLGSVSALHHRAFDAELLLRELPPPPLTTDSLITAARALGFKIKRHASRRQELAALTLPCVALLAENSAGTESASELPSTDSVNTPETHTARPALLVQMNESDVMLFRAGTNQPATLTSRGVRGGVHRYRIPIRPHRRSLKRSRQRPCQAASVRV
jgi:ATP-binding cassette, subfamily B, bacterial HlyB/CyaB